MNALEFPGSAAADARPDSAELLESLEFLEAPEPAGSLGAGIAGGVAIHPRGGDNSFQGTARARKPFQARIRPATAADAPAIAAIYDEVYRGTYPYAEFLDVAHLRAEIASPACRWYVIVAAAPPVTAATAATVTTAVTEATVTAETIETSPVAAAAAAIPSSPGAMVHRLARGATMNVVGCVSCKVNPIHATAYGRGLMLRPAWQGRLAGGAAALVGNAVRHAMLTAVPRPRLVWCEARTARPEPAAVLARCGFVPLGLLPGKDEFLGRRESPLLMARHAAAPSTFPHPRPSRRPGARGAPGNAVIPRLRSFLLVAAAVPLKRFVERLLPWTAGDDVDILPPLPAVSPSPLPSAVPRAGAPVGVPTGVSAAISRLSHGYLRARYTSRHPPSGGGDRVLAISLDVNPSCRNAEHLRVEGSGGASEFDKMGDQGCDHGSQDLVMDLAFLLAAARDDLASRGIVYVEGRCRVTDTRLQRALVAAGFSPVAYLPAWEVLERGAPVAGRGGSAAGRRDVRGVHGVHGVFGNDCIDGNLGKIGIARDVGNGGNAWNIEKTWNIKDTVKGNVGNVGNAGIGGGNPGRDGNPGNTGYPGSRLNPGGGGDAANAGKWLVDVLVFAWTAPGAAPGPGDLRLPGLAEPLARLALAAADPSRTRA